MKKNNNEGFVLAEAVVVGVFILSLFTFLFINVVPLVGKYDSVKQYDTVDAVYNTNIIRSLMMQYDQEGNLVSSVNSSHPYEVYDPDAFCDYLYVCVGGFGCYRFDWCKTILSARYLDVKTIIITRYRLGNDTGNNNTIKYQLSNNGDFTRAQKDYISSLDNYTQPSGTYYDNYHRIIVEYNDGSFANLEIKK